MQRAKRILLALLTAALALVAVQIAFRYAVEMVAKPSAEAGARPALVIDVFERPVLVAPLDTHVRAVFPVSNTGQRRLVINPMRRPCCDPPGPPPLVLEPGESGELIVQAPTAELLQAGQFRQGFGTNDPRRPEFWLTVRLANEPTPAAREGLSKESRLPDRSVLVKRPATAAAPASGPAAQ